MCILDLKILYFNVDVHICTLICPWCQSYVYHRIQDGFQKAERSAKQQWHPHSLVPFVGIVVYGTGGWGCRNPQNYLLEGWPLCSTLPRAGSVL